MYDKKHVIFVCDNNLKFGTLFRTMMKDLDKDDRCISLYDTYHTCKRLSNKIYHGLCKLGLTRLEFLLPYEIEKCLKQYSESDEVHICFFNAALRDYPIESLERWKRKAHAKLSVCFVDASTLGSALYATHIVTNHENLFEHVFSNNPSDCTKYGWEQIFTPYSLIPDITTPCINYDLYWGGFIKRRENMLCNILKLCDKKDVNWLMDVSPAGEIPTILEPFSRRKNMVVRKVSEMIPYPEMLKNTLQSNCILDIVSTQDQPITVRTYEAVAYGKKLLTNNRKILDFPFYNEDQIQYFEDTEQIDFNWVKQIVEVKTKYNNEFSPIHLLEKILY
jgi:hypothetical protein